MDKTLYEIIEDFENISKIVNYRLKQLYELVGREPKVEAPKNNIKETIDRQRQEMMAQMEKMRQDAMAQVQESINSAQRMAPNMPNMPNTFPRPLKGDRNG